MSAPDSQRHDVRQQSADNYQRQPIAAMEATPPTINHERNAECNRGNRKHGPCVAQKNEVCKNSAAAWMDTPKVPRKSGLLPASGSAHCDGPLRPTGGDYLVGSRCRTRPALTLLAALSLSACATPTVTRSCITQQQYEQLKASEPPHIKSKLTGKADEDVRPLAGSALELRAWGHALLDTLRICSETPNK